MCQVLGSNKIRMGEVDTVPAWMELRGRRGTKETRMVWWDFC